MRHQSKTSEFFKELVDQLDLLLTFGYQPAAVLTYGMEGVKRMRTVRDRRYQRERMRRLEKRQFIQIDRTAVQYRVAITEKGAKEYFRLRILSADLLEENKVCFVVFDIPERHRAFRSELRRFLSEAGFVPIQKSVWISPFDVSVVLGELLKLKKAQNWVRMYIAKQV